MSARQRLRIGLETSRSQTICWRCRLKQQRRRSSSASVSATNPPLPPRMPKHVASPTKDRVEDQTTRDLHRLPRWAITFEPRPATQWPVSISKGGIPICERHLCRHGPEASVHLIAEACPDPAVAAKGHDDVPATAISTYGHLSGKGHSSWSIRKKPSPPRPVGVGPIKATPLSQSVLWKNLTMFRGVGPPLPRDRRSPFTSSARSSAAPQVRSAPPREGYPLTPVGPPDTAEISIREHLRRWQEQLPVTESDVVMLHGLQDVHEPGALRNAITRPQDGDRLSDISEDLDPINDNIVVAPDSDDQVPEVAESLPFLQQGDLVELFGAVGPILAIFIRNLETQSQFYTMHGKWVHRLPRKVFFYVPRFVSPSLVAQITPYLPQTEVMDEKIDQMQALDPSVPREVGAALIKPMLAFLEASDEAYRRLARNFAKAHDSMAHDVEVRYATLEEIAKQILGEGPQGRWPESTLWALHRALLQSGYGFSPDYRNHRVSGTFEIRPRREGHTIERVRSWMRQYQEDLIADATAAATGNARKTPSSSPGRNNPPIAGFVRKARAVIEHSRKRRAATKSGTIGPSPVKVDYNATSARAVYRWVRLSDFPFDDAEITIIRVLEAWTATRTIAVHSSLASLGPMILRATGMYEGYDLGLATGFMFLQEIGVLVPWANRLTFDARLALPGHVLHPEIEKMREKAVYAAKANQFVPQDAMAGLRKDWGDLEVFCIDREESAEIDDGVSLERVGDSSSEFWVHVHTANPSAFIGPDHVMAKYAAHLTETVYFPDVFYPMLSPVLTKTHFSLAADRPTLTFSAKLTKEGTILDTKITPGTVRNVSYVTPTVVRRALSSGEGKEADTTPSPATTLTVGGEMPELWFGGRKENLLQTLSPSQQETLRTLRELGAAARRRRESRGAVGVNFPKPEASVYISLFQRTAQLPRRNYARYLEGDPVISMQPIVFDPIPNPDRFSNEMLVPDLMILAGEIAAKWCQDRSVPVIYRGTLVNPENQSPEAFREEHIDPVVRRLGYAPLTLVARYLRLVGKGVSSPHPIKHTILGSEAYTKVTSPLRRYSDLLAHWQIEAALRHEAQTGRSLVDSPDGSDPRLPFSYSQLEGMIPRVSERERMISQAKSSAQRHWIMQLLFRAHYFKEAPLPETFEMFIFSKGRVSLAGKFSGYLKELGLDVELMENQLTRDHGGVDIGDCWETRIHQISVYDRSCTMEPVRLIEKANPFWGEKQVGRL